MKKFIYTLFLGLTLVSLNAQKVVEKTFNYSNQFIDLDVKFASDIEVKTWDRSTVYFKADITTEEGKYLDLYQLDIQESSGSISITSEAEDLFKAFYDEWNKNTPKGKRDTTIPTRPITSTMYFTFPKMRHSK